MTKLTKKWWEGKVAYQIYPKSFNDTNGDGVGDLRGIIDKIDYLAQLGIELLWLSPVYQSPFIDQGYDISDYYAIDPVFGTMADMDELLAKAKARGIRIIMDLVINHCSDQHEWFKKALADLDGPYADYFYIMEGKDGKAPNNWRSYFGGSVWEPIEGTTKFYLHSFHKTQPDLNWQNPKVRDELITMMNWWLEKGVAGFRVDAIINIKKDLSWQSFEADRPDGLVAVQTSLATAQSIDPFLSEVRDRSLKVYDAFTVGEVFNASDDELVDFIGQNGYFSSIFDFSQTVLGQSVEGWHKHATVTPDMIKRSIFAAERQVSDIGVLSTILENHDEPRHTSFYLQNQEVNNYSKKMLAAMLLLRKGLPFIYQGQEIGMENMPFQHVEELNDIDSIAQYQTGLNAGLSQEESMANVRQYSRDNARTSMQWDNTDNGGFSSVAPWLAVNPNYVQINVASQQEDSNSLWHFYRELIALRTKSQYAATFGYGTFTPLFEEHENIMAFERHGAHTIWVIMNYQNQTKRLMLSTDNIYKVIVNNYEDIDWVSNSEINLKPYQIVAIVISSL